MMLECHKTKEYLVPLLFSHLLFNFFFVKQSFLTLSGKVINLVHLALSHRFIRPIICIQLLHDLNIKLISDRFIAKPNCCILLIPLCKDCFDICSNRVGNVLNLLSIPVVCALIEDHRCFSSGERLVLKGF